MAEDVTESVSGVTEVHNQLRVSAGPRGYGDWTFEIGGSPAGRMETPGAVFSSLVLGAIADDASKRRRWYWAIGVGGR